MSELLTQTIDFKDVVSLLKHGLRHNMMSSNNSVFSDTVARYVPTLDTNISKHSVYQNTNISKLMLKEINIIRNPQRSSKFLRATADIIINDGYNDWGTDRQLIPLATRMDIKMLSFYRKHNYFDLYQNFFTPRGTLGDLCFLNTTHPTGVRVPGGKNVTLSLKYLNDLLTPLSADTVIIDVGRNSVLNLTENFESKGAHFVNVYYLIREGATINVNRSTFPTDYDPIRVIESTVIQHNNSKFNIKFSTENGFYTHQLFDVQSYKNCQTNIVGRNEIDHISTQNVYIDINHLDANSSSVIDVRNVVKDSGFSGFKGNIKIIKEAENVSAHMTNKNLQLSENSTVFTEPTLDISTKEVECSHGCTVSNIDQDKLYYLQSRGYNKELAQQLLIDSFLNYD